MINNLGTSGKTIFDTQIFGESKYSYWQKKSRQITKDPDLANDLFHYCLYYLYSYYDLNKITFKITTERQLFYYFLRFMEKQYYVWRSDFNKTYRHKKTVELYDDYEIEDEMDDDTDNKIINHYKVQCALEALDKIELTIQKRFFYKYLFYEVIMKNRTVNEIAIELNTPKNQIYLDYKMMISKITQYAQQKCEHLY